MSTPTVVLCNHGKYGLLFDSKADAETARRQIMTNPDLLAACKNFMACLENGTLVRDISNDAAPDFTIRMLHFVRDMNAAQMAIATAEGRT